ncbi:MAG TPA: DUF6498-containing protein, partial [Chitinophagaceae bacterium]|nr:DUF6498-containing protein [Chitinophagaceae bacterium]
LNISAKQLTMNDWLIILSNLIPVFGVWFLGWSAVEVFTVYALETVIIGILMILKLLIATLVRKNDTWYNEGTKSQVSGLFFIFFFVLHFGLFTLVQTSIFSQVSGITPPGKGMFHFFFHWWEYINEDMAWMLGAFIVSYLLRDMLPFLQKKEYKTVPMMILMFQPYGRILIQQFTVILGSMFLTFKLGVIFILVFALIKIFVEVFLNFESLLKKTADDLREDSGEQ